MFSIMFMYLMTIFVTLLSLYFLSFYLSFCLSFFLTVCLSFSLSQSLSLYVPSIYIPRHSQSSATLVGMYITCTCECSVYFNVHVFNYHLCHCLVSILFLSFFLSVLSFSACLSFILSFALSFPLYVPSIHMPRHSQWCATLVGKYITCTCKCSV